MRKSDLKIETFKSTSAGGQRRDKVETCVKITHIPSGISAVGTTARSQAANRKIAMRELEKRVAAVTERHKAANRKKRRDHAIANETTIRTYDFSRGVVKDHRTGKTASLKNILTKGKLDLLR